MALSSTTPTVYISRQSFLIPTTRNSSIFSTQVTFASKPLPRFRLRNSAADASPETTTEEEASTEVEESQSYIEVPTGTPSLISALNVERALRGIPITDADYYGILGLQKKCTSDQVLNISLGLFCCVTAAYKDKVDQLMNQGLEQEEVEKKMELLKEAYTILSSEDEKRMYDWSLSRNAKPDTYTWPFEVEEVRSPRTPPPAQ
ncbi:hypothetical protein Tsubulata_028528, partial [Turnera subulata]